MTTIAQDRLALIWRKRVLWYVLVAIGTLVLTLALMALSYGREQASDNDISLPLIVHLATVMPALPLGAYILLSRKGGALHRLLGRIWVALMVTTAIVSFGFPLSFIHAFSVLVLVSTPIAIWRIRVGDVEGHRRAMEGMYIGLVMAGAFAFIPGRFLGSMLFG